MSVSCALDEEEAEIDEDDGDNEEEEKEEEEENKQYDDENCGDGQVKSKEVPKCEFLRDSRQKA